MLMVLALVSASLPMSLPWAVGSLALIAVSSAALGAEVSRPSSCNEISVTWDEAASMPSARESGLRVPARGERGPTVSLELEARGNNTVAAKNDFGVSQLSTTFGHAPDLGLSTLDARQILSGFSPGPERSQRQHQRRPSTHLDGPQRGRRIARK